MPVTRQDADTLKTHATLLSKVRRGDEEGWHRFYEFYEGFIYSAARSAAVGEAHARDIVQETMVSVQNYIGNFVPDAKNARFRTWLRTIVQSRIADYYRRRKHDALDEIRRRDPALSEETATSPINRIPNFTEVELDRLVDEKLEQALLQEARNRVKQRARMEDYQAYDFFAVQGLSSKEVAQSLAISAVTVRVRALRVRRLVQRELRRICRMLEQQQGR